ncbi:hypothetical protein [Streptomyces ardesiacus]|uniref:hypothetical protein n=1 Tax=Streptomyces ardesiacus TaxID=285564 RepID=UPI0006E156CE|nr:hypothetical protein [Streptomyces sp. NBRC 110030]NEB64058.1 hypothetical protein [Streptomyces diastaticus]
MPIRIRTRHRRTSGLAGATALVAACALTLAGCGDGDGDTSTGARAAAATATPTATATPSDSPTPEASPSTGTATPTPTPTPTPTAVTLRDLTGRTMGSAVLAAKGAHVDYTVRLQGTGQRASSWGLDEKVCEQSGGPGAVTFTVPRDGRDCAGRLLHTPPPAPLPTKAPGGATGGTGGGTGGGGTSGGGGGGAVCELKSPAGNCYADGQFCADKHHGLSTHGRGGEYLTCERDSGGRWRWSDGVPG